MLKGTKRVMQRVTNKIGLGTETVDVQFNAQETRYKESLALLEKIKDHMAKIVEAHKTLNVAAMEMSKTFCKFVQHGEPDYEGYVKYKDSIRDIDKKWREMDSVVISESMIPTAKFTGEFLILQERIELRNLRRVDMDRYNSSISSKSKKDKSTYERALAKAEGSKNAFNRLNDELKEDMPKLCNHLAQFYDYSFDNFIRQQSIYLKAALLSLRTVRDSLARVDPRSCVGHRTVITVTAASQANNGNVKAKKATEYDIDKVKAEIKASDERASMRAPVPSASVDDLMDEPVTLAAVASAPPLTPVQTMIIPTSIKSSAAPSSSSSTTTAKTNALPATPSPTTTTTTTTTKQPNAVAVAAAASVAAKTAKVVPTPVPRAQAKPMPTPTPSAAPAVKVIRAKALWDFNATDEDEISFKKGDVLTIVEQDDEWWTGELNGKRGTLPSNYVKIVDN